MGSTLCIAQFSEKRAVRVHSGKPGLPPWGPHVRFRRVQTLVREGSPLGKLRNSGLGQKDIRSMKLKEPPAAFVEWQQAVQEYVDTREVNEPLEPALTRVRKAWLALKDDPHFTPSRFAIALMAEAMQERVLH